MPDRGRFVPRTLLAHVALVAVLYFAAGKLGLLLAIPPGYATAVWPASGIALAAVLLLGYRVWPGILLGSFLINFRLPPEASSITMLGAFALPLSIGLGASLQALLSGMLIRRVLGDPITLVTAREIIRFMLLGGPLGCLVGATWGVSSLLIARAVNPSSVPFSWFT